MFRRIVAVLVVVLGLVGSVRAANGAGAGDDAFARAVDLERFDRVVVQHQQVLKTFDTYARQALTNISGKGSLDGRDASFVVLDMALRPDAYVGRDMIKIKHLPVRQELSEELVRKNVLTKEEGDKLVKSGMISLKLWQRPEVLSFLQRLVASDNRKTEAVAQVDAAARSMGELGRSSFLLFNMIPPVKGAADKKWHSLGEILQRVQQTQAGQGDGRPLAGLDLKQLEAVTSAFQALSQAWDKQDAAEVNAQLALLSDMLPQMNPTAYPSELVRGGEVVYNRLAKFTLPGAALYFVAFVLFLLAARSEISSLRLWALRTFVVAFAVHTVGIAVRWWLVAAQHDSWFDGIPIKNQFESVLFSAWFGALVGLLFEMGAIQSLARALFGITINFGRGIIGAAASFVGWLSLVAIFSAPVVFGRDIGGEIGQVNGVLMSYWLYIHVTMAVASYALIGMSFVLGTWWLVKYFANHAKVSRATAYQLSADAASDVVVPGNGGGAAISAGFLQTIAMMMFVPGARPQAVAATKVRAAEEELNARSMLATLDACNLVILQLAFWILGTAIVLGAVWADESWGRPWGWDPKETFALVTWIVYLIIVHVRFATKDKAFWTAVLSIIGFFVMLFNWIGVNFFLVGLHSYA
jgi:cytochrome c-type biogenesis protein CcsB